MTITTVEDAGVHVSFFRKPRWHTVHKLNNRMHRRLLIVDGRIAYAGGVGIADVWAGDAEDPEHWRETHLEIEGPAVIDLVGGFHGTGPKPPRPSSGPTTTPRPRPSTTASASR